MELFGVWFWAFFSLPSSLGAFVQNFPHTIDAFKVQQIAAIVHLIQLQTHFHIISCNWILSTHSKVIGIHHLKQIITIWEKQNYGKGKKMLISYFKKIILHKTKECNLRHFSSVINPVQFSGIYLSGNWKKMHLN